MATSEQIIDKEIVKEIDIKTSTYATNIKSTNLTANRAIEMLDAAGNLNLQTKMNYNQNATFTYLGLQDESVYFDATADRSVTLPTITTAMLGRRITVTINSISTGYKITITPQSGQYINSGTANVRLDSMMFNQVSESYTLEATYNGTAYYWKIVASHVPYDNKKNYIINGGFDFWQRGTSFTTNNVYTTDRFWISYSAGTTTLSQVSASLTNKMNYAASLKGTDTTSKTTYLITSFETKIVKQFAGKICAISFWYKIPTNATNGHSVFLRGDTSTDNKNPTTTVVFTATLTNSSSWVYYSASCLIPDTMTSLIVSISTNAGDVVNNSEIIVGQLMLNTGPLPAQWQPFGGSYDAELRACQRFYERIPLTSDSGNGNILGSHYQGEIYLVFQIPFKVTKRTNVTLDMVNASPALINTNPGLNQVAFLRGGYYTNTGAGSFSLSDPQYGSTEGVKLVYAASSSFGATTMTNQVEMLLPSSNRLGFSAEL